MAIEIGSLEDIDELKYRSGFAIGEHINNRQDKETVLKVKSLDISAAAKAFSNLQSQSLTGRVENGSKQVEIEAPLPSPEEQLLAMNPEDLRAVERELIELKDNPPEPYYLTRLQEVVAKMLTLHIKMAEKERIQKNDQKSKYSRSNKEYGEYQKEMGNRGMNFTWIALGLMALQFVAPESDKQFISYFSQEGCKNLAGMFNSETQSRQKMVESVASIAMAEINAMMNKGSSDASSKQEILSLLEKATEAQRRAAQAG